MALYFIYFFGNNVMYVGQETSTQGCLLMEWAWLAFAADMAKTVEGEFLSKKHFSFFLPIQYERNKTALILPLEISDNSTQ